MSNDSTAGLPSGAIKRPQNRPRGQPTFFIHNDTRLAIESYLVNASDATYETHRANVAPFSAFESAYLSQPRRLTADLTSIGLVVQVT